MDAYLRASTIIDWQEPTVLALAGQLASTCDAAGAEGRDRQIAQACFEWVRDQVRHSVDYQMNPVTCTASAVLQAKTGYCYAKSHLLAALLRANGIPAGFCYQRLSIDDQGAPYCLHGLNAVYLSEIGWYRLDSRGNRTGVNAQFTPPVEQLAFPLNVPGELDLPGILPEPLPAVVQVLQTYQDWQEVLAHLPDLDLDTWNALLAQEQIDCASSVIHEPDLKQV